MINIVIGTLQPIFRTGLAKLIASEDDLRIVAQSASLAHLRNAIEHLRPHVVLLSSDFVPAKADLEAVLQLGAGRGFATMVLIDRHEEALDFAAMGVQGILPRTAYGEMVIDCIRRIASGERCLRTTTSSDSEGSIDQVGRKVASRLTRRELKIVEAMLRGRRNADIARQLGVSVPLVKKYIGGIYDKAGVWGRLELALFMKHHEVLALACPQKGSALPSGLTAEAKESAAIGRMFGFAPKAGQRPQNSGRNRGTSFGTTRTPGEYGK